MNSRTELEKVVLGILLNRGIKREAFPRIDLVPQDFRPGFNRKLFEGILAMWKSAGFLDPIALYLNNGLSASEISDLVSCPATDLEYYLGLLREEILKEKEEFLRNAAAKAIAEGKDPKEVAAKFEDILAGLRGRFNPESEIGTGLAKAEEFLSIVADPSLRPPGTKVGIAPIDQLTVGFIPSDFIILGARPSVGKTALALQISGNLGAKGELVGYCSLEMGGLQLVSRIVAGISGQDTKTILRDPNGTPEEARVCILGNHPEILGVMSNIEILDEGGITLQRIRKFGEMLVKNGGRCMIVDHLGLIHHPNSKLSKREKVSESSTGLKNLARELGIWILALSQLNRDCETENRAPSLADLRDTGDIEQDADFVMLLHRPKGGSKNHIYFQLAKGRDVGVGDCWLYFDLIKQSFTEMTAPDGGRVAGRKFRKDWTQDAD